MKIPLLSILLLCAIKLNAQVTYRVIKICTGQYNTSTNLPYYSKVKNTNLVIAIKNDTLTFNGNLKTHFIFKSVLSRNNEPGLRTITYTAIDHNKKECGIKFYETSKEVSMEIFYPKDNRDYMYVMADHHIH